MNRSRRFFRARGEGLSAGLVELAAETTGTRISGDPRALGRDPSAANRSFEPRDETAPWVMTTSQGGASNEPCEVMAHLNVEGPTPKARAPLFSDSARSFPLRWLFSGADLDPKVAHFNGLAGANLATFAQLDLAVDED